MTKRTQTRMENIRKAARLIKPQERGVAEKIEAALNDGWLIQFIVMRFGVSREYVTAVKQAMDRRK